MEFKVENSPETAAQRAAQADGRCGVGGIFSLHRPSIIRCRKLPPTVYLIHRSESRDFFFYSSRELKSP